MPNIIVSTHAPHAGRAPKVPIKQMLEKVSTHAPHAGRAISGHWHV